LGFKKRERNFDVSMFGRGGGISKERMSLADP